MSSSGNYMSSSGNKRKPNDDGINHDGINVPSKIQAIYVNPTIVQANTNTNFESTKIEMVDKGYIPVNRDMLKDPETHIAYTKIENWVDDPFPEKNKKATRDLCQSMYDNPGNVVIVYVQCHGNFVKSIKCETTNFPSGNTITTITGTKIKDYKLIAPIPENMFVCYTSPMATQNLSENNYDNKVVGAILDPNNRAKIIEAVVTGNVDNLFEWESEIAILPEYRECVVGCGGVCPNTLLSFRVETDPEQQATVRWRSLIATSEAPERNIRSLMPVSSETKTRNVTLANRSPIEGADPQIDKEYVMLNEIYDLVDKGNSEQNKSIMELIKKNDYDIYTDTLLQKLVKTFGTEKKIIVFLDVCSDFTTEFVYEIDDRLVRIPLDKKDDKNKDNMINEDNKSYKQAHGEYFKASEIFKPNEKSTIYSNLTISGPASSLRPVYKISYSPIVDITTRAIIRAFKAVRKNYIDNCVKKPFIMGQMPKITIMYIPNSDIVEEQNEYGHYDSPSQTDIGYLTSENKNILIGEVDMLASSASVSSSSSSGGEAEKEVCKPSWVSTLKEFIMTNLYKKNTGCKNWVEYRLKPGEINPIRDDDSPFVSNGGGGSLASIMYSRPKGGSRRRSKNKPKNRKTKKTKKSRKNINRKTTRNKTRKY